MPLTLSIILLLLLTFSPAHSRSVKVFQKEGPEETGFNSNEADDLSVSEIIERANKDIGQKPGDPTLDFGDIIVDDGSHNADPCTSSSCLWPKSRDGKVYVPYTISSKFSPKEKTFITDILKTFEKPTCIRFQPRKSEKDYIDVQNLNGCYSSVGRQGGSQTLSLKSAGCLYKSTIQHEFIHALGFHHEQCRSDRDQHIKIVYANIEPDMAHNFDIVATNNLGTPYDYGSVMQYKSNAFAKNNSKPTMIPIPNPNVPIGLATEMNNNDIERINRLYCKKIPSLF